jgi:ectoine hydroxylase-related dioxygenase (phytanoyl-CoA dioxygenase family)
VLRLLALLPEMSGEAGTRRLLDHDWCQELALSQSFVQLAEELIGPGATPRRAILFDKTPGVNWNLGWHQDTKIPVRSIRKELPGFSAWSEKEGVVHVLPPLEVLEKCVALRLHLDDCSASNGALKVIPGSHLKGARQDLDKSELESQTILEAEAGDLIWMRPLVFHASSKAESPNHRRVIQIEYSSATLPEGLQWAWQN